MPLDAGARLGPYEILSPLGAGGMGEVYKARDTRLDRMVAVKVASGSFSERFEREARAVAALNHPHICTLHDVGPDYLVMEYLEGETLAARIARGPMHFAEAMKFALQMADALVAAHQKGITHRDIKPGNVMLVKSGAKLLDFGLARMERPVSGSDETVTMAAMTTPGTILGTFQYMAPEQLEGKEADARSDIFSFGALLYEMVTGQRAFQGRSQVGLMAAILEHHPQPISSVQPAMPAELDRFIAVCLAKDPDERFQSARELMRELKWISEKPLAVPAPITAGPPQPPPFSQSRKLSGWAYVAAAASLIAFAALTARFFSPSQPPLPNLRFTLLPPDGVVHGAVPRVAISPDGTQVAFNATKDGKTQQMWVRRLDSTESRPIPGTEGSETPFWSPDSKSIGFFAGGKLKRVDLAGGPAQILCNAPANDGGGSWSPDGATIIFSGRSPNTTVHRVSASGGVATPVLQLAAGETFQRWPRFLPDGKHFFYFSTRDSSDSTGVYGASLNGAPPKLILASVGNAEYASGHLLYQLEEALMARPFDPDSLRFEGEAVPLAASVARLTNNGRVAVSVSSNGFLVFAEGVQNAASNRLVWMDRSGKETPLALEPGQYSNLSLSPDGKQVALGRRVGNLTSDVWLLDLARLVLTRNTVDAAIDNNPIWSPDGKALVFYSTRGRAAGLYRKSASGLGEDELLLKSDAGMVAPNDWSRDGKFVLYQTTGSGSVDLYAFPIAEKGKPSAVQAAPTFNEFRGRFSPDGRWIAFSTNESGAHEVNVRSFPGDERKVQVSAGGGVQPQWRGDGRELYFLALDGMLMAVPIKSLNPLEPGSPVPLFQMTQGGDDPDSAWYAPTADGSRFLVIQRVTGAQAVPLTVVQNWTAALRK